MSKKYLLREYYELCSGGVCQDLLNEEEKKDIRENKAVYLTGIMQRCDAENGNNRVYSEKILKREVAAYMKLVRERRACGELDHPEDSVVNLKNASHMVVDLWWESKDLMGKIKVLSTPSGMTLQALVGDGVTLGISSRGLGSVSESRGQTIVEDDFQLICFDVVADPSTQDAFLKVNISLSEAKHKSVFSKADRLNRLLNDIVGE